jgi:hypothetical protein
MSEPNQSSFVETNYRVFYSIAQESHAAMKRFENQYTKPKRDGTLGNINIIDPEQKSFKHAFITIVFCGIFIESVLHLLIVREKGLDVFNKYDWKSYEDKLQLLGCDDHQILDLCSQFREARKEVIHEKAFINSDNFRIAQKEADVAIELVNKIVTFFELKQRLTN